MLTLQHFQMWRQNFPSWTDCAGSHSTRWQYKPWCFITPQKKKEEEEKKKKNHRNDKQLWRSSLLLGGVQASSASFCPWLPSLQTKTPRAQTSPQLLRMNATLHSLLQITPPALGQQVRHRAALWSLLFPRSLCLSPASSRLLRSEIKKKKHFILFKVL